VLFAVRCRLHAAAGSRLPGPRYGLGLLFSDLLQACMPVRLILVPGPGGCRRLLLNYLHLNLGQPASALAALARALAAFAVTRAGRGRSRRRASRCSRPS